MKNFKKVLIFSPPFDGHLNVLKDLVKNSGDDIDWKIVITGWKNIPAKIDELNDRTVILGRSDLTETDPALWTFPRVVELLDESLEITKSFQPDLIIYDFFSLEGYIVGELLDIPTWSSIPAFIGDFNSREYLSRKLQSSDNQTSLMLLKDRYGISIDIDDLEMISDGVHIPSDVNIVWSYESIIAPTYKRNRHDTSYIFVGSPKATSRNNCLILNAKPTIYVSFGTVVMNNLWNQQEKTRQRLTEFFTELTTAWKDMPWNIVFASQGKDVVKQYPENWRVEKHFDQVAVLKEADVFVTHGGSNSFHESIVAQTPMAVVPFFGDQPLVAETVAKLGIGINLIPRAKVDTHASRGYLNHNLVLSLTRAVAEILENPSYKNTIKHINLAHTDINHLLSSQINFSEGDLLFGTNVARQKYVTELSLQDEFTILQFKAFSEIAPHMKSLPRIIDIYHDAILNDTYFEKDSGSGMATYVEHLKDYKQYLEGENDFEKMCIRGLDFFSRFYKIHFILNDYNPEINIITRAEIKHILGSPERFRDCVIFYKKIKGYWIPIPHSDVSKDNKH